MSPECPTARDHYALTWGVDQLSVKLAESGQLVRFSYRVVDAGKAGRCTTWRRAHNAGREGSRGAAGPGDGKGGKIAPVGAAGDGKTYWMVFSNKGNFVKAGHRVSVVIGQVRLDGLVVQP